MKRMRILLLAMALLLCLAACDMPFAATESEIVIITQSQIGPDENGSDAAASGVASEVPAEGPAEPAEPFWHSIVTEIPNPDRTLSLNGTLYPLKFSRESVLSFRSERQKSYMQPRTRVHIDSKRYSSRRRCEWVAYEASTDRLAAFELHTADYNAKTCIPEAQAIAIAEDFLKGQCDLSQFQRKSVVYLDDFGLYELRYERRYFGRVAEQAFVAVTKRGKIAEYEGAFDYAGALATVGEIDEAAVQKLVKSLGALTYGGDAVLGFGDEWYLSGKAVSMGVFYRSKAEVEKDEKGKYGYSICYIQVSGTETGAYELAGNYRDTVSRAEASKEIQTLIEREPDQGVGPQSSELDGGETSLPADESAGSGSAGSASPDVGRPQ